MAQTLVDVIILSNTADDNIRKMTQNAINTLHASETDYVFNVVVVETNPDAGTYDKAFCFCPNEPFNYNRFLNKAFVGLEHNVFGRMSSYTVIANNDVVFHKNWFKHIAKEMKYGNFDSASPKSPGWFQHADLGEYTYPGFDIGRHFCGWLLVFRTESLQKILPLDEQFEFWCQDNDMARTMQSLDMRHALVGRSQVTHLTNQSHRLVKDINHFTQGMVERYHAKWD